MLNTKQRQKLKSLAHALKPIIMIGKKGLGESLAQEIEAALLTHELIKIKILGSAQDPKEVIIDKLCLISGAEAVENRGHIVTLYRRHPKKPKIEV